MLNISYLREMLLFCRFIILCYIIWTCLQNLIVICTSLYYKKKFEVCQNFNVIVSVLYITYSYQK